MGARHRPTVSQGTPAGWLGRSGLASSKLGWAEYAYTDKLGLPSLTAFLGCV